MKLLENPIAKSIAIFLCVGFSFALYVIAFEPFGIAEAAYIFAIPAIFAARLVKDKRQTRIWNIASFIFSYLAWVSILIWLRHVYYPYGYIVTIVFPIVISGLFIFPWFWALPKMLPTDSDGVWNRLVKLLGIAGLWILLEWIRSWIFTGFPWLLLAESQWRRIAVIQSAEYGGVWIVSYMLIFFNLAVAEYCLRIYRIQKYKLLNGNRPPFYQRLSPEFYLALILMMSGVWIYGSNLPSQRTQIKTFRVGMVQPDFAGILKWKEAEGYNNLRIVRNLTLGLKKANPDVVILPEAATPPMWPILGVKEMQNWFETLAKELGKPIITGNMAYLQDEKVSQNGAFIISQNKGLSKEFYAKRKLVPFGEYVPFWATFASSVVPIGKMKAGTSAIPLNIEIKKVPYKLGCMICYEDLFPAIARETAKLGADLIFVCTNDSWYGREAGAWQHASHCALQAVSTRRPILRSSNNGLSAVFDQYGRMLPSQILTDKSGNTWNGESIETLEPPMEISSPDGKMLDPSTLKPKRAEPLIDNSGSIYFRGAGFSDLILSTHFDISQKTFYVKYGDWVVYLSLIFFIWALKIQKKSKMKRFRKKIVEKA